jgi:hypothetical protein
VRLPKYRCNDSPASFYDGLMRKFVDLVVESQSPQILCRREIPKNKKAEKNRKQLPVFLG